MALKERISEYLLNEVGGIVALDGESNKIVYADSRLQKIYGRELVGEEAEEALAWTLDCPILHVDGDAVEWEAIDLETQGFYNVRSTLFEDEGVSYKVHYVTDVSEYMKLNRDITKYMAFFKKLAGFQTAVLEKLSSKYYELLPLLAEFFKTEQVVFMLHRDSHVEIMIYNKREDRYESARILADEKSMAAFGIAAGSNILAGGLSPAVTEVLSLSGIHEKELLQALCYGEVSGEHYALFLVDNSKMDKDAMGEQMILSVIRLYVENGMMHERLIYNSEHDGLTGLYNKGKYLEMLETKYGRLNSIGIFNFDVNNLKKMNDTYGHEAGDKLIIKAADSIRKVTDMQVHGYRIGGDEFLMVACNKTEEEINAIRERWEKELTRLNTYDDGIHCVIALGVAYGGRGYDISDLLRQADERMYEDKKSKKKPGEEIR